MPVPAFQGGPSGYFKHIGALLGYFKQYEKSPILPVLWGSKYNYTVTTPAVSALSLEKLELYYYIYR